MALKPSLEQRLRKYKLESATRLLLAHKANVDPTILKRWVVTAAKHEMKLINQNYQARQIWQQIEQVLDGE